MISTSPLGEGGFEGPAPNPDAYRFVRPRLVVLLDAGRHTARSAGVCRAYAKGALSVVMTPIVVGADEGSAGVPCRCAATELIGEISDSSYTAAAVFFWLSAGGGGFSWESIGPYSSLKK